MFVREIWNHTYSHNIQIRDIPKTTYRIFWFCCNGLLYRKNRIQRFCPIGEILPNVDYILVNLARTIQLLVRKFALTPCWLQITSPSSLPVYMSYDSVLDQNDFISKYRYDYLTINWSSQISGKQIKYLLENKQWRWMS